MRGVFVLLTWVWKKKICYFGGNLYTFVSMKEKYIKPKFENIKVRSAILDKVRKHKEETRVPIIVFVETAIENALKDKPKNKKQ